MTNNDDENWTVVTNRGRPGNKPRDHTLRGYNNPKQSEDSLNSGASTPRVQTPEPETPTEPAAAHARSRVTPPADPPPFLQHLPPWALTCKFATEWDHYGMPDWAETARGAEGLRTQLRELEGTAPLIEQTYIALSLRDNEQRGFHASSAILCRSIHGEIEFLMAYEQRKIGSRSEPYYSLGLNFSGDKRDCIEEEMAAMTMC